MSTKILLSFLFVLLVDLSGVNCTKRKDTFDAFKFIVKNGYVPKVYSVSTENAYQTVLYRIVGKRAQFETKRQLLVRKVPVFLQHGFMASSDFYLLNGREYALPFLLSDAGYDVWMGNVRGNKYGKLSFKSEPLGKKFWDFSWHDLAVQDLAAQLHFVHEMSGGQKVNFIGHSMGSTMFLTLLAQKPEYNEIVQQSFLMSPMAYMNHMPSMMFTIFGKGFENYQNLEKEIGDTEFYPYSKAFQEALVKHHPNCKTKDANKCKNPEFLLTGKDPKEYNSLAQEVIANQFSQGTSVKSFFHYGQLYNSGYFRQFDYGRDENMDAYGMPTPPDYNLQNIQVPIHFFLGDDDELSTEDDVHKLVKELPGSVEVYNVKKSNFYHLDFLLSKDAKEEVYAKILRVLPTQNS